MLQDIDSAQCLGGWGLYVGLTDGYCRGKFTAELYFLYAFAVGMVPLPRQGRLRGTFRSTCEQGKGGRVGLLG
jgi:hypothetical protein